MKIIIAGAGAVGYHLAKLLTKEKHSIVLPGITERGIGEYLCLRIGSTTTRRSTGFGRTFLTYLTGWAGSLMK